LLYKYYYAMPEIEVHGQQINAVLPFCKAILRMRQRWPDASWFAVMFDSPGPTFRSSMYSEYKAQRPRTPPDLMTQFALARQALKAMNVPSIRQAGLEADDLLACYASQAQQTNGGRATIVTTDKDLMQMVSPHCEIYSPFAKKMILEDDVFNKFGVRPQLVTQVQALAGDSADNVPGVQGVGLKTAAKLIQQHGSVEAVLSCAAAGGIKGKLGERLANSETAEKARVSLQLVELLTDVELPTTLEELECRPIAQAKLSSWLQEHSFFSILKPRGGVKPFF